MLAKLTGWSENAVKSWPESKNPLKHDVPWREVPWRPGQTRLEFTVTDELIRKLRNPRKSWPDEPDPTLTVRDWKIALLRGLDLDELIQQSLERHESLAFERGRASALEKLVTQLMTQRAV